MKMKGRDKHVLVRSAKVLPWFGLPGWALAYSLRLAAALGLYVALHNKVGLYSPESPKTFRRSL
jgi:hypothetical protein